MQEAQTNNIISKFQVLALLLILFSLSGCDSINLYFDGNKTTENDSELVFYILPNTTIDKLANDLYSQGFISDKKPLVNLADYKNLDSKRIASGKYIIAPNTDLKTLLNGFTINSLGNGNNEVEVNVTFNNCRDIPQLGGKVSKHLMLDSVSLVDYILADSTMRMYGFTKETIPALFLPDTYRMYWDTDEVTFVKRMAKEFKNFWNPTRIEKLKQVGLNNQSDAVTVASIVYKEQDKHAKEWPIIADLYLNRIRNGWKLESDPTFRFCWGNKLDGVKRLTYEHRKIDCPYNTYLYPGLPPGPICIPPAAVIDAVLNPSKDGYFFMCAKPDGDGLHNFAVSLSEHNRNAAKYQQWLTKNKIK